VSTEDQPKTILTIGGSDSGGAAGIQADLKTFTMLGFHGMSVIAAVTAQNSVSVEGIYSLPPEFVEKQLDAVLSDYGAQGVKTGFIGRVEIIEIIASKIRQYDLDNVVVDPVLVNHRGEPMFSQDLGRAYLESLFPLCDIGTPNTPEAGLLTGKPVSTVREMGVAARQLCAMGLRRVVVTGGREGSETVDVSCEGAKVTEFRSPWIDSPNTHGSGDMFSAVLCARLCQGSDVRESIILASKKTSEAIRLAKDWRLGSGHGPVSWWANV
jgi:hydroxymethylpyrimidine/phosphomethylpyrimidine kinase